MRGGLHGNNNNIKSFQPKLLSKTILINCRVVYVEINESYKSLREKFIK